MDLDELNRNLLACQPIEQRPNVTAIEEANNLKLLGSPITHEHTHERDTNEKKVSKKKKKKKKDLAFQLLKDYKSERDGDGDMTLITKF